MLELKAKVGPKGQAVIPKPIRDELGIRPGDTVSYTVHEAHVHIQKSEPLDARTSWQAFFAAFPKKTIPADYDWDADYEESYDA